MFHSFRIFIEELPIKKVNFPYSAKVLIISIRNGTWEKSTGLNLIINFGRRLVILYIIVMNPNGVVGGVISTQFNRDAQCHTHQNLLGSGLPIEIMQEIAVEKFGEGAIDVPANYTPTNVAKAKFIKWSIVRNVLHDSLTLCNWMWPMTVSPLKEKNYRGDTSLESQFFSMATGWEVQEATLDEHAERIFTLHRALTAKQMNSRNLREDHDQLTGWQFDMDPDKKAFEAGTIKLDRDDFDLNVNSFL